MRNWDDYKFIMALCNLGTLSAASESLNVSKATISRRIAKIEKDLGQPLFHRAGATYTGNQVASKLAQSGQEIEDIISKSDPVKGKAVGDITIRTEPYISNFFISTQLKHLMESNPDLRVTLEETFNTVTTDSPEISIKTREPTEESLIRVPISYSPIGIFRCAKGSLDNWVGLPEYWDFLPEMQMAAKFMGKPPIIRMGNYPGIAKAAHSNRISCIMPTCIRYKFSYLSQVDSPKAIWINRVWCAYRANDTNDPRVRAVVDWAINTLGSPNKCLCGGCDVDV